MILRQASEIWHFEVVKDLAGEPIESYLVSDFLFMFNACIPAGSFGAPSSTGCLVIFLSTQFIGFLDAVARRTLALISIVRN